MCPKLKKNEVYFYVKAVDESAMTGLPAGIKILNFYQIFAKKAPKKVFGTHTSTRGGGGRGLI